MFPDNTQRTSNMLLSILHLYGIEHGQDRDEHRAAAAARDGVSAIDACTRTRRCRGDWLAVAVRWPLRCAVRRCRAQLAAEPTRPQVVPPQGPVRQVIFKNCTSCHGIDDYAYNALDRAGWDALHRRRSTAGWTCRLPAQDRERAARLARGASSARPPSRSRAPTCAPEVTTFFCDAEAEALLKRACTSCHGIDRVNDARFSSRAVARRDGGHARARRQARRRGTGTAGRVARPDQGHERQ